MNVCVPDAALRMIGASIVLLPPVFKAWIACAPAVALVEFNRSFIAALELVRSYPLLAESEKLTPDTVMFELTFG